MIVPVFSNLQFVDIKSGFLTSETQIFFDELITSMQQALSNDGWTLPQHTQAEIIALAPDMPDGTLWYATDNELVVKINGALRKVTTTAYP